jgi:hypothetical protein
MGDLKQVLERNSRLRQEAQKIAEKAKAENRTLLNDPEQQPLGEILPEIENTLERQIEILDENGIIRIGSGGRLPPKRSER